MKGIELSYVTIKYEKPIVRFVFKEGAQLGFPEIRELIYHSEILSNRQPYVTLSDVRVDINITDEGKRVVADQNNMPLFRGTAALVKNSMYQFGANFLNISNRNKYPFKAFTDEKKAVDWLLSLDLS